jgi:thiamine pyrophosphokinase
VRALIFAGGDAGIQRASFDRLAERDRITTTLLPYDLVIAADSGLDLALALGVEPDLLIGDLDSVSAAALAAHAGRPVERHPPDKDVTDLELALQAAGARGATSILVAGGGGGRFDHLLANALLLASPAYSHCEITWLTAAATTYVVHQRRRITGTAGDTVSLLPLPQAAGVRTRGMRWELDGDDLAAGTTRGVSNVMEAGWATIEIGGGCLLVVHPEGPAQPVRPATISSRRRPKPSR